MVFFCVCLLGLVYMGMDSCWYGGVLGYVYGSGVMYFIELFFIGDVVF